MTTPYSEVYSFFMSKISDYSFVSISKEELESQLESYLITAITKFKRCKKNLSDRDAVSKIFNNVLSDEEKNILAQLMIVEYLTPKLVTAELLQQTLSSRDFKLYSQANHIKEIKDLRNMMLSEAKQLITDYSYNYTLDDLYG